MKSYEELLNIRELYKKDRQVKELEKELEEGSLPFIGNNQELKNICLEVIHCHTDYDKRLELLTPFLEGDNFKDKKYRPVFDLIFGEELYEDIITSLDTIPYLTYQKGYYKRSFRAPTMNSCIVPNRIRFLENLNEYLSFNMDFSGYIDNLSVLRFSSDFSLLLFAKIKNGDRELFNELIDVVYNRHLTIKLNLIIISTLLLTNDEVAFKAIEDLVLSAQRQEGLRQSIFELLDSATVDAQIYFMKVIIDNNLSRFSSIVRGLDVWCGLGFEATRPATINKLLVLGNTFLREPSLTAKAMGSDDNSEIYMALWALGSIDINLCIPNLYILAEHPKMEKRLIALYFINELNKEGRYISNPVCHIKELNDLSYNIAKKCLNDPCIEVFHFAANILLPKKNITNELIDEIFDIIYNRLEDVNLKETTFSSVFSWLSITFDRGSFYNTLIELAYNDYLYNKIIDLYISIPGPSRYKLVEKVLNKFAPWGPRMDICDVSELERRLAFIAIKDKGSSCRNYAKNTISYMEPNTSENIILEELLKSKSLDFRKGIIEILLKNDPDEIKNSIIRLLERKTKPYKLAALDMLSNLHNKKIDLKWTTLVAKDYLNKNELDVDEQALIDKVLNTQDTLSDYTVENGFGLYNPNYEKDFIIPTLIKEDITFDNPIADIGQAIINLDKLYEENKDYEYIDRNNDKLLLGNHFCRLKDLKEDATSEEIAANYPLIELWRKWFIDSKLTAKDLFLIDLNITFLYKTKNTYYKNNEELTDKLNSLIFKFIPKLEDKTLKFLFSRFKFSLRCLLDALTLSFPYDESEQVKLYELAFNNVMASVDDSVTSHVNYWYSPSSFKAFIDRYSSLIDRYSLKINAKKFLFVKNEDSFKTYWKLLTFMYRYKKLSKENLLSDWFYPYKYPYKVVMAFKFNLISEDEFIHNILEPNNLGIISKKYFFDDLQNKSLKEEYPFLEKYIEVISKRVLDIELNRGESATEVSLIAQKLYYVRGIETFARILKSLGTDGLYSGYIYSWSITSKNKKEMFSFLLSSAVPYENETQDDFNRIISDYKISKTILIEAAIYSTAWLEFIGNYLKIPHFSSAVWWLHAHASGTNNKIYESEIAKYSTVSLDDFANGALDIDWFKEIYSKLKGEYWTLIYDAAKYITEGSGYRRTQLYADAILGKLDKKEVLAKIIDKRNLNQLKAYGIIPLSKGKAREGDILTRYRNIEKFKKESKQFGAHKQESEGLAAQIALDNLARNGGFSDPIRLTMTMENNNTIDILKKSKDFIIDDLIISLYINGDGDTSLKVQRGEKELKSIPVKYSKDVKIIELKELCKTLNYQKSRVIKAFENAMNSSDYFRFDEINSLIQNPVISPILRKIIFVIDNKLTFWNEDLNNGVNIEDPLSIRIAHSFDLFKRGDWAYYQNYLFVNNIKQPFKQVYRELYIPTEDELLHKFSRRYEGHQVSPKQTLALLKTRGWKVDYDEGLQKYFAKEGIIAKIYVLADWFTPSDIESPTLEAIEFYDKSNYESIRLDKIPPLLFSEIMRDIDLVVSVAYVGDVDPEASHSTVEMRSALVRETISLFKLSNVSLTNTHITIDGKFGRYSIHLGSGIVHKMLSSSLSIIPVHSQHRGTIFLPFLDSDPKSGEIISKMLLLAKDDEIQDPTILRQIM